MNQRAPTLVFDCRRDDLSVERLRAVGEDTARRVVGMLGIDAPGEVLVTVAEDGPSHAVGDRVRVSPWSGRGLTVDDSFELLLAHELTHVLMRRAWGTPPVLWWEGLPIHLGDDFVRARALGRSYDAYCRILLELGAALPLGELMAASDYYRRRPDFRVDLIAGSFAGFVLRTRGSEALGAFVQAVERPEPNSPRWVVTPAMVRHLGADLAALERQWHTALRELPPPDPSLLAKWGQRHFDGAPPGRVHCDVCFAPVSERGCETCGAWAGDVVAC